MSQKEAIDNLIEQVQKNPPQNESTTCLWVINPLLLASGYTVFDIYSQHADNNGNFPDYTILPNTPNSWFLEAKSWNVPLQDSHVQQSLNYANTNGRPWVVLTNGKVWRLYDNTIQGLAIDKFVVEASLDNTKQIYEFLNAISKVSVTSGGLEKFAFQSRLVSTFESALYDPDSKLVKTLYSLLKNQPGLSKITPNDIVQYFRNSTTPPEETIALIETPFIPVDDKSILIKGERSLEELITDVDRFVTGKKPENLILPNGQKKDIHNWRDIAFEIVLWLANNNKLPEIPYRSGNYGHRYLLNLSPHHQKGNMREYKTFAYNGQTIYMDMKRSAGDFLYSIARLCKIVGMPSDSFKVITREEQY